jgi:hypothetical protein
VGGRIDTAFVGKTVTTVGSVETTTTDPFKFKFSIEPAYDFGFAKIGLAAGLEIKGQTKEIAPAGTTENTDKSFSAGFGAYINKALGNGAITTGVAYTLPTFVDGKDTGTSDAKLTIPVIVEYSF